MLLGKFISEMVICVLQLLPLALSHLYSLRYAGMAVFW